MTTDDPAQVSSPARSATVELVALPPATIHSLAAGNLAAANLTAPAPLTPFFVGARARYVWGLRSRQVEAAPAVVPWITGAVVDTSNGAVVGYAGFHGPPDAQGMVEVGYTIDPEYRRRGHARAALRALLDRARREPSVRTVRATIGPDNVASRSLVLQHGFVEVGEQWDDEDGLEIVFEVPA